MNIRPRVLDCKCDDDCPVALNFYHTGQRNWLNDQSGPFQNGSIIEQRMRGLIQLFLEWDELSKIRFVDLLLDQCQPNIIRYLKYETTRRLKHPSKAIESRQDFTRILPRSISIRIFSYLSPRTLGRCAQVSGYWKYLSESNEIWETKFQILAPNGRVHRKSSNGSHHESLGAWKNSYKQYAMSHPTQWIRMSHDSHNSHNNALVPHHPRHNGHIIHQQRPTKIPIPHHSHQHRQTMIIEERRTEQTLVLNRMHNHRNGSHYGSTGAIRNHVDDQEHDSSPVHRKVSNENGQRRYVPTPPPRRRPRQSKSVTPWRPSAPHPEDMHFDKIGKRYAKTAQNIRRVPTPSPSRSVRPSSSTHNLRITRDDRVSDVNRSSSNKNLGHALETNIYLNDQDDHDPSYDFVHQNVTISAKNLHVKGKQNGNGAGTGHTGSETNIHLGNNGNHSEMNLHLPGTSQNGRERNISLQEAEHHSEHDHDDDPVNWRFSNGGATAFVSGEEEDDDSE